MLKPSGGLAGRRVATIAEGDTALDSSAEGDSLLNSSPSKGTAQRRPQGKQDGLIRRRILDVPAMSHAEALRWSRRTSSRQDRRRGHCSGFLSGRGQYSELLTIQGDRPNGDSKASRTA